MRSALAGTVMVWYVFLVLLMWIFASNVSLTIVPSLLLLFRPTVCRIFAINPFLCSNLWFFPRIISFTHLLSIRVLLPSRACCTIWQCERSDCRVQLGYWCYDSHDYRSSWCFSLLSGSPDPLGMMVSRLEELKDLPKPKLTSKLSQMPSGLLPLSSHYPEFLHRFSFAQFISSHIYSMDYGLRAAQMRV